MALYFISISSKNAPNGFKRVDLSSEPSISFIRTGDRMENPDQLLEDLGSAIGLSSALSAFFLEKKMYDSRPVPLALGTGKE